MIKKKLKELLYQTKDDKLGNEGEKDKCENIPPRMLQVKVAKVVWHLNQSVSFIRDGHATSAPLVIS